MLPILITGFVLVVLAEVFVAILNPFHIKEKKTKWLIGIVLFLLAVVLSYVAVKVGTGPSSTPVTEQKTIDPNLPIEINSLLKNPFVLQL